MTLGVSRGELLEYAPRILSKPSTWLSTQTELTASTRTPPLLVMEKGSRELLRCQLGSATTESVNNPKFARLRVGGTVG
jgi:hypothetical protein